MNLVTLLGERALEHPERIAIVEGRNHTVTYGELWRRVGAGAEFWRRRGLAPGHRVMFAHPVGIRLYEALLGALHAGLTAVFADPSAGLPFLRHCCEVAPPHAFFGSAKAHVLRVAVPALRRAVGVHGRGVVPFSVRWGTPGHAADALRVADDHPALVTFTSGSTGLPKGAVRTHGFLLAQHAALAQALEHRPGEIDVVTLPVFLLSNLASGMTSVIADTPLARPGRPKLPRLRRQFAQRPPARGAASPAFFGALAVDPTLLRTFRRIDTGGAPVFPKLLEALHTAAPQAHVFAVYGSTEAEPIAHIERGEISSADRALMRAGRGLLTGRPVPQIQLAIVRDCWGTPLPSMTAETFAEMQQPSGEAGEIVVSGDHVLPGYLHGRGDDETKFRVDRRVWHRTGDAGWLDSHGRLWLLGRCAAAVTLGGEKVYPFSLEVAAGELPGVERAAFIEHGGKRLLVLQGTPPPAALASFLAALPPGRIEDTRPVKRLPLDRRHQAKIDYPALRALLDRDTGVPRGAA